MPERREVLAALGTVIHPTYGLSLVTLQMVSAVEIEGDSISVQLLLDCSVCASREAILGQVHRKLGRLLSDTGHLAVSLAPQAWSPPWEDYWFTSGMDAAGPIDDDNDKDEK